MKKQYTILLLCLVGFIFYYGFMHWLGIYPLLDVDETRYVDMAKNMLKNNDYLTLYLNGDYFFEKPPLYFWLECFSFTVLGVINEFSARIPIVLLSLLPAGFLFFLCKKIKNTKFAIISLVTLFTSLEYMFMTKVAILDSVLTSFVTASVLSYFATFFVQEKNKKYFWSLTYVFSALAVLAKGIPGVAIPAIIIAISTVVFKTYKETLKYSWGILVFLLITLPWHIIMLKIYPNLFFQEYIYKHHILRFLGSNVIHRSEPWYFYFITLLWGLFPHIFVLFSKISGIKNIKFDLKDDYSRFLLLNTIAVLSILGFFSLSSTKLITYILPIYPFFAVIIGAIWFKYIKNDDKAINISMIVLNSIWFVAIILLFFIKFILPQEIYIAFQKIQIITLIIIIPFVIASWIFIIKNQRVKLFFSTAILMSLLSGFLTPYVYEFNYTFGQNDLMKFAEIANKNKYTISTYLTGKKYSLLYYGNQKEIKFYNKNDINWLKKELKKKNNIVIVRNREIKNLPVKIKIRGFKYSIIER